MNRAFTKILALALLVATSLTACKKDKDDESLAVTKENLAATYTLSSIKLKVTGAGEKDVTNDMVPACEKDDQVILKSDLTVQYKDAGTECAPPGNDTGVWSLTGSTITMDGDDFTVKSLTKGTLVLEETYTTSGITMTYTTTFNRK